MAASELNTGLLLLIPYRSMEGRILDRLNRNGFDITSAQARVFQRIAPSGSRLTDLATQAGITKQTAGFLVDQLEGARYVERRPDPADARAKLVCVAPRGLAAADLAGGVVAEIEQEWTAHLGERRYAQLRRALSSLREITDPYAH